MNTVIRKRPQSQASRSSKAEPRYDYWLTGIVLAVILLGLVMVTSASITMADQNYHDPFFFLWRQLASVAIGLILAAAVVRMPLAIWQHVNLLLLFFGVLILALVLVPGIGRMVNGSMRWIDLGLVRLQGSEPMKIFLIIYLAGYLVRHGDKLRSTFAGFIRPMGVVILIAVLLLMEPDYGTTVVIFITALGMLFIGGVPIGRFLAWMLAAVSLLGSLAVISPYRMERLTSFIDPWQDPYNSGFQLTQALIAFGRGDWNGAGLGGSVQKLFYLPEAHTDFVFAVMAEELGLAGSVVVILAFFFIIWRAFVIAQVAEQEGKRFASFLAYGAGLMIGTQAFINIGVNTGMLPTKGLTLPLMSYGGNSMVVNCVLIGLLIRVEYENHHIRSGHIPDPASNYAA